MREKPARASKPCEIYIFTNSDDLTKKETKKSEKKKTWEQMRMLQTVVSLSLSFSLYEGF